MDVYTGNPVIDQQHRPNPRPLGSAFHIIFAILSFLTLGALLPVWLIVGMCHYFFVYLPRKARAKEWDKAYAVWYQQINASTEAYDDTIGDFGEDEGGTGTQG